MNHTLTRATDTFPNVGTTAEWAVVRQTKNFQSNGPVTDVTSKDMRCYQMKDAADVLDVTAGSSVAYHAKASISHPGPMSAYIAKVPEGQDVKTWDPEGKVWSKIYGDMPNLSAGGMSWPSQGMYTAIRKELFAKKENSKNHDLSKKYRADL